MGAWIDILEYRDFHDVPRVFVVSVTGVVFLFDCQFDQELGDYPDAYALYAMGHLSLDELPDDWNDLAFQTTEYKGQIAVCDVTFDKSKRKQMKCAALQDLIA